MKRQALLQHLRRHGCILKREGASHSLWQNPLIGRAEIPDLLAKKICKSLSIPAP